MMKIPKVVANLVEAQNNFDSVAYARCFSETAIVIDEGKNHQGRKEIEDWIADANKRYNASMKPVSFEEKDSKSIFKAEVSGNFEGSPILMSYHLEIANELIQALKITG